MIKRIRKATDLFKRHFRINVYLKHNYYLVLVLFLLFYGTGFSATLDIGNFENEKMKPWTTTKSICSTSLGITSPGYDSGHALKVSFGGKGLDAVFCYPSKEIKEYLKKFRLFKISFWIKGKIRQKVMAFKLCMSKKSELGVYFIKIPQVETEEWHKEELCLDDFVRAYKGKVTPMPSSEKRQFEEVEYFGIWYEGKEPVEFLIDSIELISLGK